MTSESKWMIRSGGRISGPFTADQVPLLLKSREIQLRDEIASPEARWLSLEFHPTFAEEVDAFKRQIMNENTEVSLTPIGKTGVTQTLTDLADHELTDEIHQDLSGYTTTQEIVVKDIKEEKSLNSKDIYSAQYQLQGIRNNPILDRKVKQTSAWIQVSTVLLLLVLGAGFFFWNQSKRPQVERLSEKDFKAKILSEIELGNYVPALYLMKARSGQSEFIAEYGIYYSLLLLQVDQQTLLARRALDQILATQPQLEARALGGIGLSHMIDGQWLKSLEYFERAIDRESGFYAVRVNKSVAKSLSKNRSELENWSRGDGVVNEPEALTAAALFAAEIGESKYLEALQRHLTAYLDKKQAYRSEVLFAKVLIDNKISNQPVPSTDLIGLLDGDPQGAQDQRFNVFIYRGHMDWANLLKPCLSLVPSVPGEKEKSLFEAFCQFRARAYPQARSVMEQLIDKYPKDALVQSWYALTLRETGSLDQASVALGRAMESNRGDVFKLPILLQARFCEAAGNQTCAYEAWKSLLEMDYNSLPALAGLAQINAKRGAGDEAQRLLNRGLALSPDYKPFLSLKRQ